MEPTGSGTPNLKQFGSRLQDLIRKVLSCHDVATSDTPAERIYHVFMVGLTLSLIPKGFAAFNNIEAGVGRVDIIVKPSKATMKRTIIMEFKKSDLPDKIVLMAQQARSQIRSRHYHLWAPSDSTSLIDLAAAFHKQNISLGATQYKRKIGDEWTYLNHIDPS